MVLVQSGTGIALFALWGETGSRRILMGSVRLQQRQRSASSARTTFLIAVVSILAILGMLYSATPFVQSLQPKAKTIVELQRIPMPGIASLAYAREVTPFRSSGSAMEVLFVRRPSNK